MEEEKWTDNMKEWMDIDEVLLDERLYQDRGYLYFGTSQLKSDCFSITVPGTGPLHITKENGIKLADAIYKSEGVDLRAEVTRLTRAIDSWKKEEVIWKEHEAMLIAERDRMREYIKTVADNLEEMLCEDGTPIYREDIMGENIMSMVGMLRDALQEPTDD